MSLVHHGNPSCTWLWNSQNVASATKLEHRAPGGDVWQVGTNGRLNMIVNVFLFVQPWGPSICLTSLQSAEGCGVGCCCGGSPCVLRVGMTTEGPGGLQPRNDTPSIALEQQWARIRGVFRSRLMMSRQGSTAALTGSCQFFLAEVLKYSMHFRDR